jgi:prophage regulatory protein
MELDRIVRMRELVSMLSMSRSSIYRLISLNEFPAQLKLSTRTVGWRLSVIEKWIAAKESSV